MSSSINLKQSNLATKILKRTASMVGSSIGSYFTHAMPTTVGIVSDIKANNPISMITKQRQNVITTVRGLRQQVTTKNILRWYLGEEADLDDDYSDYGDTLTYDTEVDEKSAEAEISKVEMSESAKNARDIQLSVVKSSHQLMESQINNTANILSSINSQTEIMKTGFDKIDDTLTKILEVVTKNTSTLIEATAMGIESRNIERENNYTKNIINDKFNLSDYKKLVKNNFANSELGLIKMMGGTFLSSIKEDPGTLISVLFDNIMEKKAPNFKNNLKVLDKAVNDVIVDSLIRIGQNNKYDIFGSILKNFGINPEKENVDTSRNSISVKAVPFDGIVHESITNTIPGYLRKILVQLGGKDEVYDYRSRKFVSQSALKKEFFEEGRNTNSLYNANSKIQNIIGNDDFGRMVYELMLNEVATHKNSEQGRQEMNSFFNPSEFKKYVRKDLLQNMNLHSREKSRLNQIANNFANINDPSILRDINLQAVRNAMRRNQNMEEFVDNANRFNVDLSHISDNYQDQQKAILEKFGKAFPVYGKASISSGASNKEIVGVDYTNLALYKIFKRLDKGINVFQVGSKEIRRKPFKSMMKELNAPIFYKTKTDTSDEDDAQDINSFTSALNSSSKIHDENNLLNNNLDENGNPENLSKFDRFKRWGSHRAGQLGGALFNGSPEQVKDVFGAIIKDVAEVSGNEIKKGISSINNQFGNVTGYLKHKMFGTEYTFQDGVDEDGNPIMKKVAKNEKGGIFGFVGDYVKDIFKNTKEKGQSWFEEVKGYFNYGTSPDESDDVKNKRKKLISASVGAFAGAGLLGGPIGLIMGAVAGNAIGSTDIMKKIKESLFGREEDGSAKGIFTKLGDFILDPIKYQIGKTLHHFSSNIKNNILGPLSDIGFAIKDRITSAAESRFGKVFKTIGEWILKPFKFLGNGLMKLFHLPAAAIGSLFRAKSSVTTGVVGFGMNMLANIIAGNSEHTTVDENGNTIVEKTSKALARRRADRKEKSKNDKYKDFDSFKNVSRAERAERMSKFNEYIKEDISTLSNSIQELNNTNQKSQEREQEIAADVHTLAARGSEIGSIYTHDQGLHDRFDKILDILTNTRRSNKLLPGSQEDGSKEIVTSAVIAASSNEDISPEEFRLTSSILDESTSNRSDKKSLSNKLKQLMRLTRGSKKDASEKKETIFDKIKQFIGDIPGIAKLAGLVALISSGIINIENILKGIGNALNIFNGNSNSDDTVSHDTTSNAVNSLFGLAGAKVKNWFSAINPFANVYHTENDAAGNPIVDQAKTKAKFNFQFGTKLREMIVNPGNMNNSIAKGIGKNALQLGGSALAGFGIGKLANKIAKGVFKTDDETAEKIETAATTFGTATMYAAMKVPALRRGPIKFVFDLFTQVFDAIKGQIFKSNQLAAFGNKICNLIDDIFRKLTSKLTDKMATKFCNTLSDRTGKEVAKEGVGAVSGGLVIAAAGVIGTFSGLCNTEYLFKVVPDDADILMNTISSALGGIMGALQWTPVIGLFAAAFDIADQFIFDTIFGKTVMQMIAEACYNGVKQDGGAELAKKQDELQKEVDRYNKRFGANLNVKQFNDLVNNNGFIDKFMRGKTNLKDWGAHPFDEGGNRIDKGFKGLLSSNEGDYMKDEDGNILKDSNGNAIVKKDAFGNSKVKNGKFGNVIAENWNKLGKHVFGGEIYETDSNGNAKIEDGKYVVKEKKDNLAVAFGKKYIGGLLGWQDESTAKAQTVITSNVDKSFAQSAKDAKSSSTNSWNRERRVWNTNGRRETLNEYLDGKVSDVQKQILNNAMDGLDKSFEENHRTSTTSNSTYRNNYRNKSSNNVVGDIINNLRSMGQRSRTGGPLDIIGGNPLSKDFAVTSQFGMRNNEEHRGIDLIPKDQSNDASVLSTMNGQVLSVKNNVPGSVTGLNYRGKNSGGNEVIIKGDDGLIYKNYHLKTGSIPNNLKRGSRVFKGQTIGKMGSTGRSGGSHLHYQVEAPTRNGRYIPINPLKRIGGKLINTSRRIGDIIEGEFETWINIIKDIKQQIASRKRGYECGGNVMNLKSNGFELNIRTDCSGMVSACVSCLIGKRIEFATSNQKSAMKNIDNFTEGAFPGWDKLYQGDIILRNGHTEIFAYNDGNRHYVWNCGSNASCNDPNPTITGGGDYHTVFRLKSSKGQMLDPLSPVSSVGSAFSNLLGAVGSSVSGTASGLLNALSTIGNGFLYAVTGGLIGSKPGGVGDSAFSDSISGDTSVSSSTPATPQTKELWNYFKGLGYSDIETAAILGAWRPESGHVPQKVEWDYGKPFKEMLTLDKVNDDRQALSAFTERLFQQYDKEGIGYDREAYRSSEDGLYYPGIGLSQWTGGRAKELLDYAKRTGKKWYDGKTQLDFMNDELKNKQHYQPTRQKMQEAKDLEGATRAFMKWYVGYTGPKQDERVAAAKDIYNQLYDSAPDTISSAMPRSGGPLEEDSFISDFNNSIKYNNYKPNQNLRKNIINNKLSNSYNPYNKKIIPELENNNVTEKYIGTDVSGIISALQTIITHLASINSNTNSSNTLLTNLNEKDFVDKGLRNTLSSMKVNKPNVKQSSYLSAKSVAALARP